MDWLDRMNAALDYIEANLAGTIDLTVAARGAGCSEYHFSRMFSFITGVPLNEYIRRRRLTLAGFELRHSDARIIDLALKYGYDSPNSFTRAFQALHGVTPSEARTPGVALKSFPRMSFVITIKGVVSMNYRIVEKGAFTVFGKSFHTSLVDGQAYHDIPYFWDRCEGDGTTLRIVEEAGGDERTMLSAVAYDDDADGNVRYMICLDLPAGGVPDEFEVVTVPAKTWAVFSLVCGSPEDTGDGIQGIWKRLHTEWFPNSGYEWDGGPRQERHYRSDDGKVIAEAWCPVRKSTGH